MVSVCARRHAAYMPDVPLYNRSPAQCPLQYHARRMHHCASDALQSCATVKARRYLTGDRLMRVLSQPIQRPDIVFLPLCTARSPGELQRCLQTHLESSAQV